MFPHDAHVPHDWRVHRINHFQPTILLYSLEKKREKEKKRRRGEEGKEGERERGGEGRTILVKEDKEGVGTEQNETKRILKNVYIYIYILKKRKRKRAKEMHTVRSHKEMYPLESATHTTGLVGPAWW